MTGQKSYINSSLDNEKHQDDEVLVTPVRKVHLNIHHTGQHLKTVFLAVNVLSKLAVKFINIKVR